MTIKKILIVDDEKSMRTSLALALRSPSYETSQVENGLEAIECLRNTSYDLLITDYVMPKMDGLQLMKRIKKQYPSLPVLVISGDAPVQKFIEAGASGFLQKPFDVDEIKNLVCKQLYKKNDCTN
ncbi:MAG: response regulator [Desulfobacteraceae bacterium]|jgi:DNA-binding NtrC family response regulator